MLVLISTYLAPPQGDSLLLHVADFLSELAQAGGMLFFTLSGYLLTASLWDTLHSGRLAHPAHWLRNFYARRALRVFPLYYATLALATVVALARGVPLSEFGPLRLFAFLLENLPFLKDRAALQPSLVPLHHLWPVALLLQFACAWPLLLLAAANRRRAIWLTAGLTLLSFVFCWGVWSLPGLWRGHSLDQFPLTFASTFALGALVALLRPVAAWRRIRAALRWTLSAGLTGCLAVAVLDWNAQTPSRVTFLLGLPSAGIACASLLGLVLDDSAARRQLAGPVLVWPGRLSYGMYVFHVLLLSVTDAIARRLSNGAILAFFGMRCLVGLTLSVLAAAIFFELIEGPLRPLLRRFPFLRPAAPG